MSLFIATGSNLGDKLLHLKEARDILSTHFKFIAESRIYESPAVDYLNQPNFYNQVLEFKVPDELPQNVIKKLLEIENLMGRNRIIPKGPRVIDIDILFWNFDQISLPDLTIPHPRLFERSFVVLPLSELPGFLILKTKFSFKFTFDNTANPIS